MDSSLSCHSTKATLYKIDRLEKDDNIVIKILFANGKIAEVILGQSENSVAILLSGYSFVSLRHETMASITDSIS